MTKPVDSALSLLHSQCFLHAPIDIFSLARNLKLTISFDHLDPQSVEAILFPETNSLTLNLLLPHARIRYLIALTLGLFTLHKEVLKKNPQWTTLYPCPYLGQKSLIFKTAEIFALHILMPKFPLDHFPSEKESVELCKLYEVSSDFVSARYLVHSFSRAFKQGKYKAAEIINTQPIYSYPITLDPILHTLNLEISPREIIDDHLLGFLLDNEICFPKNCALERKRFTMAHLIGSFLFAQHNTQLLKEPLFSFNSKSIRAHSFAAHLLLPQEFNKETSSKKLAKRYLLPVDLVEFVKLGDLYV